MFSGISVYRSALDILNGSNAEHVIFSMGALFMRLLYMQPRLSSAYLYLFMSVERLLEKYSLTPFLTHDRRGHFEERCRCGV